MSLQEQWRSILGDVKLGLSRAHDGGLDQPAVRLQTFVRSNEGWVSTHASARAVVASWNEFVGIQRDCNIERLHHLTTQLIFTIDAALTALTPAPAQSSPTITFNGPVSGVVHVAGRDIDNTTITLSIAEIVARIDAAAWPVAEKDLAKSKLEAFLSHPLVAAIVGGAVGGVAGAV